jgi:hypothetical protein
MVREFRNQRLLNSCFETVIQGQYLPQIPKLESMLNFKTAQASTPLSGLKPINDGHSPDASFKPRKISTISSILKNSQSLLSSMDTRKFYDLFGQVIYIGHRSLTYDGCPICVKKVTGDQNLGWFCGNCGLTVEKPVTRFIGKIRICDDTDSLWAMVNSDENGKKILGKNAEEMKKVLDEGVEQAQEYLRDLWFAEFNFRVMAKATEYNGETSVGYTIVGVNKSEDDYGVAIKNLVDNIRGYDGMEG